MEILWARYQRVIVQPIYNQCQFLCLSFFERKSTIPLNPRQVPHRYCVTEGIVPPHTCTCGCLAYYYGLSGRLPGWWSPSELDSEISSRLWCVGHQGNRVELVWSSASHLTLVNSSNESGLFLSGLFFISRVRGHRPRLAVCRSAWADGWGRGLKKGVREGVIRAEGEGGKCSAASWLIILCFLCVLLLSHRSTLS